MSKFKSILGVFIFFFILSTITLTQEKHEGEVNASVEELKEFHSTIYEIWHSAWPNKDIALLEKLLPDIKAGYTKLQNAKLPGILRDKKEIWDLNLKTLSEIIAEYQTSIEKKDSVSLLNASEKLHSQYERIVRVIRPILKELEAFHQTLYMLYHYYTPEYNYDKVKQSVDELSKKMDALNKAKLPERLHEKTAEFNKARKELATSLKNLRSTVKKEKDKVKIIEGVEKMHTEYKALEAVFD
jgi:DNA repair exonuclease SbcCD ATPase subunit